MRIICVIPNMGPGGAERAMARLSAALSTKHDVVVVTWQAPDAVSFYTLPSSVKLVNLSLVGGAGLARGWRLFRRFSSLRNLVADLRPNLVLSFMDTTNVIAVTACLGTGVPVVVSERTDPAVHSLPVAKRILRDVAYNFADKVVVQTERVRSYFSPHLQSRIVVIPNPAPRPLRVAIPDRPGVNGRYRIMGLGRLSWEKGFDRLIAAFGSIAGLHPDWDLVIFGEGDQRSELEGLVRALGLDDRIRLPGLTCAPEQELAASHIMVLPSRYEGFPNALAEAVATGLPAVAFEGISGAEDLIKSECTGLHVCPQGDATQQLASALHCLMADSAKRVRFGLEAQSHAAHWDPEMVHKRWEDVLLLAARKNPQINGPEQKN